MVGMGHMAIFLTLNEDEGTPDETELYLVDVGFGGPNQAVPLPLSRLRFCDCRPVRDTSHAAPTNVSIHLPISLRGISPPQSPEASVKVL